MTRRTIRCMSGLLLILTLSLLPGLARSDSS